MIKDMHNYIPATVVSLTLGLSQVAHADVDVVFREGAPKDRFSIVNTSECALDAMVLTIDLANSDGRLIFDTTGNGAGVEVFQPFEVSSDAIELSSAEDVKDGDTQLTINIKTIGAGESVSFTIDVDDTLVDSKLGKIRVAGSEIHNGEVQLSVTGAKPMTATFNNKSVATLVLPPC